MKKLRFILIFSVFSFFGLKLFAHGSGFFSSEVLLGTGLSIYEDDSVSGRKELLNTSDYKRILAELTYNAVFSISEPIKIVLGADLMSDFLWEQDMYFHTLDYAFCTGIKVFPGAQGLNLGICYTLGNRTDFTRLPAITESDPKENEKRILNKSWGNGFKLNIQYDFLNSSSAKVKPVVGAYYRFSPRGGNFTDHTLCIYGGVRL